MSDLMIQVLLYMAGTFVLGVAFGWLVWRFGGDKQHELMMSEVKFWRGNLEQSRIEREGDLQKIEALSEERETLKKRLEELES